MGENDSGYDPRFCIVNDNRGDIDILNYRNTDIPYNVVQLRLVGDGGGFDGGVGGKRDLFCKTTKSMCQLVFSCIQ